MQAVIVQRYGGPDVLALVDDRPEPAVGPRDVRIKVAAASLNPLDFKIREGKLKMVLDVAPPIVLGCDVAGTVDRVGADVKGFAVGDEVYARLEKNRMAGLAQYVAADAGVVAKKPTRSTFAEAASIPLAALTALQALREAAGLTAGQRVLIHAGAGGVGSLAVQIAKILGLHVTATTSGKNADFVRALGADTIVDYTKADSTAAGALGRVDGDGPPPTDFDAVFDTLGTTELASIAATKRGGVVVGVGGLPDAQFARDWLPGYARPALWLMTGRRRRACKRAGVRFVYLFMRPDGAQLAELAGWIDAGKLRPILHRTYPFAEYREAFAELERGRARGKIVLTL